MRLCLLLLAMPALAHADDATVAASAALGAGAQGDATYGAVDVTLTAAWPGVRIGLGARGVWDDGVFRSELDHARLDAGASIVAEVGLGASAVAFGEAALDRDDIRYTLRADLRAGETASLFGPLYRIERTREITGHIGAGAGITLGA